MGLLQELEEQGTQNLHALISRATVLESESYKLQLPSVQQPDCSNAGHDTHMVTNPVYITAVERAQVFFNGSKCMVRSPTGEIITHYGVDDEEVAQLSWKDYRTLNGTTLLLGNSQGANCYYHWMLDLLPKLGILEGAGIKMSSIDRVLVRELMHDFQKETLAKLGFDNSRIIETKHKSYYHCEKLLHVEADSGINMKMHRFIPSWLKHVYPPVHPVGKRIKLYITRPNCVRRSITNEADMMPVLQEYGYTITAMEGLSVEQQSQLLARTDVLVSPHGGALTNMVFCRPGIQICELYSRHVYPYYYGLSQMCGHHYHAVLESSEDYSRVVQYEEAQRLGSTEYQIGTLAKDFAVNIEHFRASLNAIEDQINGSKLYNF